MKRVTFPSAKIPESEDEIVEISAWQLGELLKDSLKLAESHERLWRRSMRYCFAAFMLGWTSASLLIWLVSIFK